jgi:hypothetical protein
VRLQCCTMQCMCMHPLRGPIWECTCARRFQLLWFAFPRVCRLGGCVARRCPSASSPPSLACVRPRVSDTTWPVSCAEASHRSAHWPPLHHRTHVVALLFLNFKQQTHKRPCTLLEASLGVQTELSSSQLRATVNPWTRSTRRRWDQVRKRRLHSSQVHQSPHRVHHG